MKKRSAVKGVAVTTFAILTAEAGPAHVPDQASLLLLTVSLLGLVTYRRRSARKEG